MKKKQNKNKIEINMSHNRLLILNRLISIFNLASINNSKKIIIGISGFPGSGKTTLAIELKYLLEDMGYNVILLNQDDFRISKIERYNKDGSLKFSRIPLINQWHNWKDLELLLKNICICNEANEFETYTYDTTTKDRTHKKKYHITGKNDIVIVEGAFIFNVGKNNIYGVKEDAIEKLLDYKVFVFKEFNGNNYDNWIIKSIYEREKNRDPNLSHEENLKKAQKLYKDFEPAIKVALDSWQMANIKIDNTDFDNPQLKYSM